MILETKDLAEVDPQNKGLSRIDPENKGFSSISPKKGGERSQLAASSLQIPLLLLYQFAGFNMHGVSDGIAVTLAWHGVDNSVC
ncbi:MAG: hypothetical protein WAM66_02030 [Acidobacteriaceae bacterium]